MGRFGRAVWQVSPVCLWITSRNRLRLRWRCASLRRCDDDDGDDSTQAPSGRVVLGLAKVFAIGNAIGKPAIDRATTAMAMATATSRDDKSGAHQFLNKQTLSLLLDGWMMRMNYSTAPLCSSWWLTRASEREAWACERESFKTTIFGRFSLYAPVLLWKVSQLSNKVKL